MIGTINHVAFPYIYDLYYRVRHGDLECEVYSVDFVDWVKAGVAYNVRGIEDPQRSVAYFGELYRDIKSRAYERDSRKFRKAVTVFYEDLFLLYNDHLSAQLKRAHNNGGRGVTSPQNLVLLPSFEQIPELMEFLPLVEVILDEYCCVNPDALQKSMASIYVQEHSQLFRGMALYFDYGVCRLGDGVILGVK